MQFTRVMASTFCKIFIFCIVIAQANSWFSRVRIFRRRRTVPSQRRVNCVMNAWSKWSDCSSTSICTVGIQDRHRTVKTQPSGLGTSCPPNYEVKSCGTHNGGCSDFCDPTKTKDPCFCRRNRVLRADKKTCVRQDSCQKNGGQGDCEQICHPTRGCDCKQGYQLGPDNKSCLKLDCKNPVFPDCRVGSYSDKFGPVCKKVAFSCPSGTGYRGKCLLTCPKGFGLIISSGNKKPYLKDYRPDDFHYVPDSISCDLDWHGSPSWTHNWEFNKMYCRRTNDPPEDIALSRNILQEHDPIGTLIGRLTAHDPQFYQSITFSVQSTFNGTLFDIRNNRRLVSNWVPRNIGPQSQYLTVEIKATDNDKDKPMYLILKFQIVVVNVNDPPHGVQLSKTSVSNTAPVNTVVGTLSAVDEDGPGLGKRTSAFVWRMVDDSFGMFKLSGANVLVAKSLQAYSNNVLTISVRAKDNDRHQPQDSVVTQISINVVDDNTPPTSLVFNYNKLFENHAANTAIGTLTATDKNSDVIRFDMSTSDQSVKDTFKLGSVTCRSTTAIGGQDNVCSVSVILTKKLDYEKTSKYTLKVTAKDKGGKTVFKEFNIEVHDVNEPPTNITLSSYEVPENSQTNVVVANIKVTDPDNEFNPRQRHSCSLKDPTNVPFKISQLHILVKDKINYETVPNHQYKVSITCKDITVTPLSITKDFVIKIKNINEAPTNLRLSSQTVRENAPINHVIGTLSADDPDLGPPALKYDTINSTSPLIVIGGRNQNELILKEKLDFEAEPMFDVVVKVTDPGGLSSEKIFRIQVEDVNEGPSDIRLLYHNMTEDSPPNTLVTAVDVIDADKGATHTCTVVNPNAGYLQYRNRGLYATSKKVDYEAVPGHKFMLHLKCTDNKGLSLTKSFTINIIDINEEATSVQATARKVPENEAMAAVGQITVIDPDINQQHVCEVLANGKTHAEFEVDPTTLKIKTKNSLNFEQYNSYPVIVRCLDQPKESWQKKYYQATGLIIYVLDSNERPQTPCQSPVYISDEATNGTVVHTFLAYDPDNEAYHRSKANGDLKSLVQPKQRLTYSIDQQPSVNLPFNIVGDQYLMMSKKLQRGQKISFKVKVVDDGTVLTYNAQNKLIYTKVTPLDGIFTCEAEVLPDSDPRLAPDIALTSNRVSEKATNDTLVGEIRIINPRPGKAYTFTLPDDSTPFSLNGNKLIVSNAKLLNYEVTKMYNIIILATDEKGNTRAKTFIINVTDYDECLDLQHPCDVNAQCVHRNGKPGCVCKTGYQGNGSACSDINECDSAPKHCSVYAICRNSKGSFSCHCRAGFNGNGITCTDVNECSQTPNVCHHIANCTNTPGSFTCKCRDGFTGDGKNCKDINECTLQYDNCHPNATCLNEVGSFDCKCPDGLIGDGRVCADVDECQLKLDDCHAKAVCTNTQGSFTCSCRKGYTGNGKFCIDIDECKGDAGCHKDATCRNTLGSYECRCKPGYRGNGIQCTDIDECRENMDRCHTNAQCHNLIGGYKCTCNNGYYGDGDICKDVNECDSKRDNCHENATCLNTPGHYKCFCKPGFSGNGMFCKDNDECLNKTNHCHLYSTCMNNAGSYECRCNQGFQGNGVFCTDINECLLTKDDCHSNANCVNSVGSFKCACKGGFTGNGKLCIDIDECYSGKHQCHKNAKCLNTIGGYRCKCRGGYEGNGYLCRDINECKRNASICHRSGHCTNLDGSFSCGCHRGYAGDGFTCEDVDECKENRAMCDPNALCTNTIGSYHCHCTDGFTGSGVKCYDVDECSHGQNKCHPKAICENSVGSYVCKCLNGFVGNGSICRDVDECKGLNSCGRSATCQNTEGSYGCKCNKGFRGNGRQCADIDECFENRHQCHEDATCINTFGSYQCRCKAGFTGHGKHCYDVNECSQPNICNLRAKCINTVGSYRCQCRTGFTPNGKACDDVNECVQGLHNCHEKATCVNLIGSFRCKCKEGYSGSGVYCQDVDECHSTGVTARCGSNAGCTNTPGAYNCSCNKGFSGNGFICEDINECESGTHLCSPNANCKNTFGGYRCKCKTGYSGNGKICTDIDECKLGTSPCDANANCRNSIGSYQCTCKLGYVGNGYSCTDLNECQGGSHGCHKDAFCQNIIGRYKCVCKPGFSGDGQYCHDFDECSHLAQPCNSYAICNNTYGSYACRCRSGFTGNGIICGDINECESNVCSPNAFCQNKIGSYACTCQRGFTGNGHHCKDIDECRTSRSICHLNAKCKNSAGSFTCQCNLGYRGSGFACSDINECVENTHKCDQNAVCSNNRGSYSCLCKSGYSGDGEQCADVDECKMGTHNCSKHAVCSNVLGSYTCSCFKGYQGDGKTCTEVDECKSITHNCDKNAVCSNSKGSYICSCNPGYSGNGRLCTDINECSSVANICGDHSKCNNVAGSFTCQCNKGYTRNGNTCVDINECTAGSHSCDRQALCSNSEGSFDCTCKTGFTGSGTVCNDINECTTNAHNCDSRAKCINTAGSYICQCNSGLTGDGKTCQDINEKPTDLCLIGNTIKEGSPAGTRVGTVIVVDSDLPNGQKICATGRVPSGYKQGYTCELTGKDDASAFRINQDVLVSNAVLAFSRKKTYSITVLCKDNTDGSLQFTKNFTVSVLFAGCNQNSVAINGACVCKSGFTGRECDRTDVCYNINCPTNHVCVSLIRYPHNRCVGIAYQVPLLLNRLHRIFTIKEKFYVYVLEDFVDEVCEGRSGDKNLQTLIPASPSRKKRALPSEVHVQSTGEVPVGDYTYIIMVVMDPNRNYALVPSADVCQKLSSNSDKGIRCVNEQDCEILKRHNIPCPYGSGGLDASKAKEEDKSPTVLKEPGQISLIVLGFIVLIAVAVGGMCFIRRRRRSKESEARRPFDDRLNITQGTHQNPVYGTPDLAYDNRMNGSTLPNNFAQPAPLDNRHDVKRFTNNLYADVSKPPHDFSNPVYGASPPPAYSQVMESPVYESVGFKGGKKFKKEVVDLSEDRSDLKKGTNDKISGSKPNNIGISNKAYEFDDLKKGGQSKA